MATPGEVTFELQHFQASDGALRIAGRWHGMRLRGFHTPVLTVTVGGQEQRLDMLPGEHDEAGDGRWFAAFAWLGDPRSITAAQLQVGRRVVVTLPPPHRPRGGSQDYEAAAEPAGRDDGGQAQTQTAPFERLEALEARAALRREQERVERLQTTLAARGGDLKRVLEQLEESRSDSVAQRDRAERLCVELQAAERRHMEQLARLEAEIPEIETRRSEVQALESALAAAREDAEHSRATVQALRERLASTRGETRGAPTQGVRRSSSGPSLSVGPALSAALRGVRRGTVRVKLGALLLVSVLAAELAWLVVRLT